MKDTKPRLPEQLALDIGIAPAPSLENFAVGDNTELLFFLKNMRATASPQFCYIWGASGTGKTHLAQAFSPLSDGVPCFSIQRSLYSVDEIDTLSESALDSLFKLINDVRSHPGYALLMTGRKSPAEHFVRRDILSRLTWGPVYEVRPLRGEIWEVLLQQAADRGISVSSDAKKWMQVYLPRDIKILSYVLDAMDKELLKRKKASVTVPMLKSWLIQHSIEINESEFSLRP